MIMLYVCWNQTLVLKLLSSLNTLGYIEFDVLGNLSYLEEKLYTYADLPWLSRHTYHVFGKYNNKGQYIWCNEFTFVQI
jgi:hypothetical protein